MESKFGVELEMVGISREKAIQAARAIGVELVSEGYNHSRRGHWKIVSDASVRGEDGDGFEVVSPVLEGDAGLEELRAVVTALADVGGKVNRTCGFHVHFDAADLNVAAMREIVTRYADFEAEIDAFMPPSRRGDEGRYCRSLRRLAADRRFLSASTLSELIGAQAGRYFKVNLQSYHAHGTIEFRQHSGTLDAQKAVNWVRFLGAFVARSKARAEAPAEAPTVAPAAIQTTAGQPALRGVQARLAEMFRAQGLVALAAIQERFGWQPHSARAAVCRLRQSGMVITRDAAAGGPGYRLEPGGTQAQYPGAAMPAQPPQPADSLWTGVAAGLRTFYRNRAAVLAVA